MHLGRRPDEAKDPKTLAFYEQLLDALKLHVMRLGRWRMLASEAAWAGNPTARNVLAFSWDLDSQRVLVTVNYGPTQSQCYVKLPWRDLAGDTFVLRDRLSDAKYVRPGDDLQNRGLYLDVPPWHTHLFELELQ
jgi:hypothetical protein